MHSQARYVVRTPSGYVGRTSLDAPLADTMPHAFAYVWLTLAEAQRVASRFAGATVEEVR